MRNVIAVCIFQLLFCVSSLKLGKKCFGGDVAEPVTVERFVSERKVNIRGLEEKQKVLIEKIDQLKVQIKIPENEKKALERELTVLHKRVADFGMELARTQDKKRITKKAGKMASGLNWLTGGGIFAGTILAAPSMFLSGAVGQAFMEAYDVPETCSRAAQSNQREQNACAKYIKEIEVKLEELREEISHKTNEFNLKKKEVSQLRSEIEKLNVEEDEINAERELKQEARDRAMRTIRRWGLLSRAGRERRRQEMAHRRKKAVWTEFPAATELPADGKTGADH